MGNEEIPSAKQKNLLAQKRYRERQKAKREEIESQVSVLSKRIEELEVARNSLAARNKSLQRFSELQEAAEQCYGFHKMEEETITWDSETSKQVGKCLAESFNLLRRPDEPEFTAEGCKERFVNPEGFQSLRREFCVRLCEVSGHSLDPPPEIQSHLTQTSEKMRVIRTSMVKLMQNGPLPSWVIKQRLATVNPDTVGQIPHALPSLVENMGLTDDQKEKLTEARLLFIRDTLSLQEKRLEIVAKLKQCNAETHGETQDAAQNLLRETAEVQLQLQDNLFQEGLFTARFGVACMQVISAWQEVRLTIDAFINHNLIIEPWDIAAYLASCKS